MLWLFSLAIAAVTNAVADAVAMLLIFVVELPSLERVTLKNLKLLTSSFRTLLV